MDFLDYASGGEDDDCNVDDIEYDQEREDYIESSEQLNAVSDLEFIASNAADCTFDFNGQTSPELNIALPPPDLENDESSSDGDSEDDEGSVKMVAEKVVESSSSSDSSDSEEEVITKKQYNKQSKQIHWLTEEEGEDMATGPLKTKNEIDEVVEPLDHSHIEIRDTADLTCIGEVMYRIDHECVVVIQADYTTSPLNEGSIICNIDGKVLGKVQEIFGPITTPFYTVRWKNAVAAGAGSNNKGGKGGAQNKKQNNKNNSKQKGKKGAMVVETAATAEEPEVIAAQPAAVAEGSMDTEIELDSSLAVSPTAPAVADIAPAEKTASATTPEATAAVEEATAVSEPAKVVSGLEISDVRALFPVGARLFTVTSHCSFVLPAQLQKAYAKGSDASNAYDEEVSGLALCLCVNIFHSIISISTYMSVKTKHFFGGDDFHCVLNSLVSFVIVLELYCICFYCSFLLIDFDIAFICALHFFLKTAPRGGVGILRR